MEAGPANTFTGNFTSLRGPRGLPATVRRVRRTVSLLVLSLLAASCSRHHVSTRNRHHAPPPPRAAGVPPAIELVESWPVETELGNPDIPDAADAWLEMVRSATATLDFAEFYASDEPGSRLHEVIGAVEAAADRGVKVRFLLEESFYSKYPETVERLARHAGITVRHFDRSATMGGILHAKYFVVDGREAYEGSQNFDWRSLEHIQELGIRMREPTLVQALASLFEADWDVCGGAPESRYAQAPWPKFPIQVEGLWVSLGVSPKGYLPRAEAWDLPVLVRWIDEAEHSVKLQVLTYKARSRDGGEFHDLDDALRRAAARGVKVHLLVSSWGQKESTLAALAKLPNVEVGVLTIPPWSKGEIPFARVVHAKFLVVDEHRSWVGTSNWEGDYFLKSRNVGLFVDGDAFSGRVSQLFDRDAASPYVGPLPAGGGGRRR